MADLDDIQRSLHEIRDLMKQDMEATAKRDAEAQRNTELALTRQATAMRIQRISLLFVLAMILVLVWLIPMLMDT